MKTLTFEDLERQIQAQNAELARLGELAKEISPDVGIPASALAELEEATEAPVLPHAGPMNVCFSLRA